MKAAILVGGLGTRLRQVVPDRPKPMADVDGKPFLIYLLKWLKKHDISEVVLCVGYRWRDIEKVVGDGSSYGLCIEYSVEDSPLGTGGALKNAEPYLSDTFLAMNGDSFLDVDIKNLVHNHKKTGSLATLALSHVNDTGAFGAVETGGNNAIGAFREKAGTGSGEGWINGGVYVLEPEILSYVTKGKAVSLEREVFPALIQEEAGIHGFKVNGYFIDIGTPENYLRAQKELEDLL